LTFIFDETIKLSFTDKMNVVTTWYHACASICIEYKSVTLSRRVIGKGV